jgi:hypothetical protein
MAKIREPEKALALIGLISGRDLDLERIAPEVSSRLGGVLARSEAAAFNQTDYYGPEMGGDLIRQWWTFETPVEPDALAGLKRWTNAVEEKHLNEKGGRRLNIDPGLITLNSLILASTKNYSHRIYLGQGIYAETTLIYRHNRFQPLEWTYPDYKTDAAIAFFGSAREYLKKILHGS